MKYVCLNLSHKYVSYVVDDCLSVIQTDFIVRCWLGDQIIQCIISTPYANMVSVNVHQNAINCYEFESFDFNFYKLSTAKQNINPSVVLDALNKW